MKIVATSDWHPDRSTHGLPRFADVREAVHRSVDLAIEEGAGLYLFLGDLCDPDAGSVVFRCAELAIEAALRLRARGIRSIWLAGNHDVIEDGSGDTSLTPLRPLQALEGGMIRVAESFCSIEIEKSLRVLCLPYSPTARAYDPAPALRDWSEDPAWGIENTISISHLSIAGVAPGEETKEMPRGRDVWLPVEDAKRAAGIVLSGHYHRRQKTDDGVWIVGSLARLTFSEEGNEPGFLMLEA